MSMENNLKEFIEGLIHEVEKDLDETTATGNVAGYQTPNAFSDKGKSDKKRKKKIATQLGYSVVDGDVDNISEAIKGRNNKTGESFGMVIGSDKQGNNGYELKVRKMYNSRISSYGFIFDKDSNLTDIRDYGYSLDGKFPDMKGHASSTSVRPNKRETITQIAKITSPAFAKKIYQHVQKNNKMNESVVNEASKLAMGIAGFTGTRGVAVDDFIQKHKIDAKKLFNFVKKGNLKDRMAFVGAIAGRPNNKMFKMITKQFGESVNEAYVVLYSPKKGVKPVSTAAYKDKKDAEKWAKDLGGITMIVKKKVKGIDESVNEAMKPSQIRSAISKVKKQLMRKWKQKGGYENFGQKELDKMKSKFDYNPYGSPDERQISKMLDGFDNWAMNYDGNMREDISEAKVKRPVNRWLELKNDESMHPHKKMAMGLKELKYQLRETEKFFNWYNKIKTMNELDSNQYWKRTNSHIYKIKERLINIARTIQEIEK